MICRVEPGRCIICGACMVYCKEGAITVREKKAWISPQRCTGCGNCIGRCLTRAIYTVPYAEP